MRYRLRTLLMVLALGPPVLAALWLWRAEWPILALELIGAARRWLPESLLNSAIGLAAAIIIVLAILRLDALLEPVDDSTGAARPGYRIRRQLLTLASVRARVMVRCGCGSWAGIALLAYVAIQNW